MSSDSPLLSIIVTTYNVAQYIGQCLDSAIRQRMPAESFEILVIDDHSNDGTLDIVNEYAEKASNIKVIPLPVNTPGGFGFSANFGIKKAQGKWIGFIDGDDYASVTMFPKMISRGEKDNADIVICDWSEYLTDIKKAKRSGDFKYYHNAFSEDFAILPNVQQKNFFLSIGPAPWRKIYRSNFLRQNKITIPVGDFFYEDTPLHWSVIILADRISCVSESLITHRSRRVGQTEMQNNVKAFQDMKIHMKLIKNFLDKNHQYDSYAHTYYNFIYNTIALYKRNHVETNESEFLREIFTSEKEMQEFMSYVILMNIKTGRNAYAK
jgi:glycosyltransferase involved in cell wall biosynthesis